MIARRILITWLVVGLLATIAPAVQVYAVTHNVARAGAVYLFGVVVCLVAGLIRIGYEWRLGGLDGPPISLHGRGSRVAVSAGLAAFLGLAAVVAAIGRSTLLYLPVVLLTTISMVVIVYRRRNSA